MQSRHIHACPHVTLQVDLWDHARSDPISSFQWGSDTVVSVRFNPAEPDLFASTASDRSLALYDLRSATPVRKLIMQVGRGSLHQCCHCKAPVVAPLQTRPIALID